VAVPQDSRGSEQEVSSEHANKAEVSAFITANVSIGDAIASAEKHKRGKAVADMA